MTITARARMDDAWTAVVGRHYSLAAIAITAVVAIVLGIAIGAVVAGSTTSGSAGLSNITSVGGLEPRQGGR